MTKVSMWKRFKGWVIALKNRYAIYSENLLFVTRVKTLAVHLSFVLVLLVLFWVFLDYAQNQILNEIIATLEQALLSGNTSVEGLESVSVNLKTTYAVFFAGILGVMSVILYFLAGLTLRPIRKNMESQRRFIADVSHELRTPLTVMRSASEVALLDGASDEDRRVALKENVDEINRVSLIINNLVSFTHMSALSPKSFHEVDLSAVVKHSIEKLKKVLRRKGDVGVEIDCPKDIRVYGNEIALEQVVVNLVKNATSHTPSDGRVSVVCFDDGIGKVGIAVKDTGAGIPKEDIENIFDPFFKSGKSKVAETGSVGLGLSIVQEVVRSHKGSIDVESVLGEGTTITILLPKSR